jgi:alkylation response protein AidB-like acyl-CoA dehydrogenase
MAKRDLTGTGLALVNQLSKLPLMRRKGVKAFTEQALTTGTRTGFQTIKAASQSFKAIKNLGQPVRMAAGSPADLFDLTPSDEQQMLVDAARSFAEGELRDAAASANEAMTAPAALLEAADGLGFALLNIPEALGGAGQTRETVTNVLTTEALAYGDLSLAVACLAPVAVATVLADWGDAEQQATYLAAFTGERLPSAALALMEPQPLADAMQPLTTAIATAGGYRLTGEKSLVVRGADAQLLIVSAMLKGKPRLFIVEGSSAGLSVAPEPAMGLRAASTVRLKLDDVAVPLRALLGDADSLAAVLLRSRLAWCALGCGTGRAVLDFVIPYVNERQAFGEPISHRQSVAFAISDMAIELEGLRLLTLRAASRLDAGKPAARELALARQFTQHKLAKIGSDGVQLLGGHGFTKEYPVERWYRDLRACGVMDGVVLV